MTLARTLTVFRKELSDVLRDRRTLIATVVVPVVLYPLLMLLSLQAVSTQTVEVRAERITVGVTSEADAELFEALLNEEALLLPSPGEGLEEGASDNEAAPNAGGPPADAQREGDEASQAIPSPEPSQEEGGRSAEPLRDSVDLVVVDDLRDAVLDRGINVGVALSTDDTDSPLTRQLDVTLTYQPEQIRSEAAADRVETMLRRVAEARVTARLAELNIDRRTIEPVVMQENRVSTPGSLLGLIVPTLLVLMTVTSAIYPAIDLTAGEHERGTLESLLVTPVPAIDLVVGKFLAVATIGLLGAVLNLASVAATAYFGGLGELIRGATPDGETNPFPWAVLPIVMASLVPFSVLMAAILIAVSSCARSFKEAQNYMTPVMIAVLLPAMVASLPGAKLEGLMLVLPVGNIVLLVRELLSGAPVGATPLALVLLSTCAYAAAAVTIAAQAFGKETVMFADSVSLRALLSRRVARPRRLPTLTLAALYTAVLFPVWFYLQTLLQQVSGGDLPMMLRHTAVFLPMLFVVVPVALLWYWKIDLPETLQLRVPTLRHLLSGVLFGAAMWVAAHEVFVFQQALLPTPDELLRMNAPFAEAIRTQPMALMLLFLAVVPAVSEELFFRGFLQSGLTTSARKWTALIVVAAAFALFHFFLFRFGTTFALGLALAWLTWQARSIWPAILAHALHNGQAVLGARYPQWHAAMGIGDDPFAHLPWPVLVGGGLMLLAAIGLSRTRRGITSPPSR